MSNYNETLRLLEAAADRSASQSMHHQIENYKKLDWERQQELHQKFVMEQVAREEEHRRQEWKWFLIFLVVGSVISGSLFLL